MVTAIHHPKHPAVKILVLATSVAWTAAVQAQSTWYVDDDGLAQLGCTSWEDACSDLQTALGLANSADEIRVAQGTYRPAGPNGDRAATFQLLNEVVLLGGYLGLSAGKGQDPDDRDIELYQTILSGDLNGNDGPDFENNGENSYHVVTGDNTDQSAVIDGFTIVSGHAEVFGDNHGGGMHNLNGSPTVNNCTFTGNAARGDQSRGGAMFNRGTEDNHTRPTITNCTFIGNLVESVGAGTTNGWGGAIWNAFSDPAISNCTFLENQAVGNVVLGGAIVNSGSSAIITDCTFIANTVTGLAPAGGAMANGGGLSHTPTLINCAFIGNATVPLHPFNDGNGGAMANFTTVTLINCVFVDNTSAVHGGALYNHESNAELVNCRFNGNIAGTADNGSGGALFNTFDSHPILTNCTLAYNVATSGDFSAGYGGGMANYAGSDPVVTNSILWGNVNGDGGTGETAQVYNIGGGAPNEPVVNFSCIEGGWSGAGGVGNTADDPLFVNTPASDFHLQPDSPCVDAGSNAAVPGDIATDLDGNPRFIDGDDDGVAEVDMGAYEFQGGVSCPADLDGDGTVGASDLAILLGTWGPVPTPDPPDFDGDGDVDAFDLAILLGNWGPCP